MDALQQQAAAVAQMVRDWPHGVRVHVTIEGARQALDAADWLPRVLFALLLGTPAAAGLFHYAEQKAVA